MIIDGNLTWPNATRGTYAMVGNRYNWVIVIPEYDMVIVRIGDSGFFTSYRGKDSPINIFLGMINSSITKT